MQGPIHFSNEDTAMAESIKDKLNEAGHKISETSAKVGHTVSEKAEEAGDWLKEKAHQAGHAIDEMGQKIDHKAKETFGESCSACGVADIKKHMDVVASCGTKVGRVDDVEGSSIKLTKNDSPDGMHHLIPAGWVASVDSKVHLDRDHKRVQSEWQPA